MEKNFFESLLDFSFSSFIAPKVIGILYGIGVVFACIAALGVAASGFTQGLTQGIVTLILAPIVGLLYVLFIRIALESMIAGLRTAENTALMVTYLKQIRDK